MDLTIATPDRGLWDFGSDEDRAELRLLQLREHSKFVCGPCSSFSSLLRLRLNSQEAGMRRAEKGYERVGTSVEDGKRQMERRKHFKNSAC